MNHLDQGQNLLLAVYGTLLEMLEDRGYVLPPVLSDAAILTAMEKEGVIFHTELDPDRVQAKDGEGKTLRPPKATVVMGPESIGIKTLRQYEADFAECDPPIEHAIVLTKDKPTPGVLTMLLAMGTQGHADAVAAAAAAAAEEAAQAAAEDDADAEADADAKPPPTTTSFEIFQLTELARNLMDHDLNPPSFRVLDAPERDGIVSRFASKNPDQLWTITATDLMVRYLGLSSSPGAVIEIERRTGYGPPCTVWRIVKQTVEKK
jgi:DNA-directed RNA polymerase subunit H (RpoH/RPB5)